LYPTYILPFRAESNNVVEATPILSRNFGTSWPEVDIYRLWCHGNYV